MKYNIKHVKVCSLILITFSIAINLSAQTPYSKPAPYRNVKDYQESHPNPKYTPGKPKTTTGSGGHYTPPTVEKPNEVKADSIKAMEVKPEPFKASHNQLAQKWFNELVDEHMTAQETEVSVKTAKEIMKLIESASNNFAGYKGTMIESSDLGVKYTVIDPVLLSAGIQFITIKGGAFIIDINSKGNNYILRNIFLSFYKQIPFLTSATSQYKIHQTERDELSNGYAINSESGGSSGLLTIFYAENFSFIKIELNTASNSTLRIAPRITNNAVTTTAELNLSNSERAKQWLANTLATPLTAEEEIESTNIAKALIKIIQSASKGFKGYKGKFRDSSFGLTAYYHVINTDFLQSTAQYIWSSASAHGIVIDYSHTEGTKNYMRNISLAFLIQIPQLTAVTEKYEISLEDRIAGFAYSLSKASRVKRPGFDLTGNVIDISADGNLTRLSITIEE